MSKRTPALARSTRRWYEFKEVLRRKLYHARALGVGPRDTVLDVGSGHGPNWRANVLCDKFAGDATERLGSALASPAGRPFVIGDALHLPFRDQAFDFVVCSHVLEHVEDPEQMLRELSRVARRGYIETPSRIWEKLHSLAIHRWLISLEEGRLVLEQKARPVLDSELEDWLDERIGRDHSFQHIWMRYWEQGLAMQYWWEGEIPVEVRRLSPAPAEFAHATLAEEDAETTPAAPPGMMARLDATCGRWLRRHSQPRVRDVLALLACPLCRGGLQASADAQRLTCCACGAAFPQRDGVPVLLAEAVL